MDKKSEDILIRFDTIPACDGQTDMLRRQRPRRAKRRAVNTRNSAIADKPRDAFRDQLRSPTPFHMLGMVCY